MTHPWNIPSQITQGDRVTWKEELIPYDNLADILHCYLRGTGLAMDLIGVPDGLGWRFTILEADSVTLAVGQWHAQFVIVTPDSGRQTIGRADFMVCPGFNNLTEYDGRSDDQKELDALTIAIARLASGAVAEYRIGDRMMRYQDLEQLTKRQAYLRNRIARAKNPGNVGGKNVGIRFSGH
jgi:hypothetical protein